VPASLGARAAHNPWAVWAPRRASSNTPPALQTGRICSALSLSLSVCLSYTSLSLSLSVCVCASPSYTVLSLSLSLSLLGTPLCINRQFELPVLHETLTENGCLQSTKAGSRLNQMLDCHQVCMNHSYLGAALVFKLIIVISCN
jgi:hypothetical protein